MHKFKLYLVIIAISCFFTACSPTNQHFELPHEDLTCYVNPFVGTDAHGHTFPGATLPFGMVQLSPDTRLDGWDGCSAYHFSDSIVYGFSHTHLSGTGCSDYGDILLMPMCKNYATNNQEYASRFSHETEIAKPGYYSVLLENDSINVELTTTKRVGFHRYKFNKQGKRYIVLDLAHRDKVLEAGLRQQGEKSFTGVRRSQAWAQNQHIYFAIEFSENVKIVEPENWQTDSLITTENLVYVFEVEDENIDEVLVKVAISQVDEQGAKQNLDAELSDWDFDKVVENARNEWNAELNKIIVKGGSDEQRKVFYTAMYHACLQPNIAQDVDGRYRGTDMQVHKADDFTYYTVFSLWDTYRAAHPLYTITQQKRTADFIKTFLAQYSQSGYLPMWELSSNETKCMIGYHAVPVIVDAYTKGLADESQRKFALEAMIDAATKDELGKTEYAKFGFLSINDEHESVSKTLEYAYDDWCIAQFAKMLGNENVSKEYFRRSQAYKHIFNKQIGFMCPRQNGAWKKDFDPKEVDFNFTEANSWQYSFYVPHDMSNFIQLMGGNTAFETKLDELFTTSSEVFGKDQKDISGMIGQYAHGNEPSHHIAYLYNYCQKPAKTQQLVRKIMAEMYNSTPAGNCGNEDCGQMSAWYILSALGFYPVNPTNGFFDLGSPLFDTVQISLDNGKKCLFVMHNNSAENCYIEKIELNGKNYSQLGFNYSDIAENSRFDIYMTSDDNTSKCTDLTCNCSLKNETARNICPAPYSETSQRTFHDSLTIALSSIDESAKIFYSVNNKPFTEYLQPFAIDTTCNLQFYTSREGYENSQPVHAHYVKTVADRRIKLFSTYNRMYHAGGDDALIDGLRGSCDFRTGEWQGYQGQDFVAIVDLQKEQPISKIETGFFQDLRSWIVLPKYVEYFVSNDGENFKKIAHLTHNISDSDYENQIYNFHYEIHNCTARYVKVFAKYYGVLPSWHLGHGGESFVFIDEIIIR